MVAQLKIRSHTEGKIPSFHSETPQMFETWNEAPLVTTSSICIHVMFSNEKQNSPSGGVAAQARGAMTIVWGVVRGGLGLVGRLGKISADPFACRKYARCVVCSIQPPRGLHVLK